MILCEVERSCKAVGVEKSEVLQYWPKTTRTVTGRRFVGPAPDCLLSQVAESDSLPPVYILPLQYSSSSEVSSPPISFEQ